jgi:hypothetical protein
MIYTDKLETNDMVATTDAVDGLVGEVPAAYAWIVTAVFGVDHQISTKSFALSVMK